MEQVTLLNIPNYFSSYYLKGLNKLVKLEYKPNEEFKKFNNSPFIIFKYKKKIIIIDNRDPVGVQQNLYDISHIYFATNKLKNKDDYRQPKIQPLFPHYPIDNSLTYLRNFRNHWVKTLGVETVLKEIYSQIRRPYFREYLITPINKPYIFFSGSIWLKEREANCQRADFIRACKNDSRIIFEGGLIPRKLGDTSEYEEFLGPKRFNSREFQQKSSRSLINFNNPAVLGAVSWRLAEYLNMGTFILSLPFKVALPLPPEHGKEIHMIKSTEEIPDLFDFLLANPIYHQKISRGAKAYFDNYCTPKAQIIGVLKLASCT